MSIFDPAPPPWPSRMLSILRIVTALMFITAGTMKLFNYPPLSAGMPPIPLMSMGQPAVLDCFIFLYLVAAGPGIWSLDAQLSARRARRLASS